MNKDEKLPYIIGGIVTIFVCLLCCATASYMLHEELLTNSYVKTEAEVIGHHYIYDDDYGQYYDVVQFTVGDETYTKVALNNGSYAHEPNNIGDTIVLYYNPKNPNKVLYRSSSHVFMIVVTYIVSIGCAIGAVVIFRKFYKALKAAK